MTAHSEHDSRTPGQATPDEALLGGATTGDDVTTGDVTAGRCCGRREVLQGSAAAALLGTAALGLSACGSGSSSSSGTAAADGSIMAADVPVGGAQVFPDTKTVVAQPRAGTYVAFDTTCTHAGCNAKELSGTTLTCPCHGSEFDATTGAVTKGPATQPLAKKTVTESGGSLTIGS